MAEFNVRSDAVNVEQIMEQIRSRIREKRGVDYTEEQIRELAAVKLQKFLDPRGVRSDLLDQFRKTQPPYAPPELPNYVFEENTLFDSHRGLLRFIRALLKPLLKLFFNPNPLIQALNIQSRVNTMLAEREARLEASRRSTESLYYELIHNLVVETTRLGIEVKNMAMRIESMSSRLEFNERRARALEGAVVYRPAAGDIVVTAPPEAQPRYEPPQRVQQAPAQGGAQQQQQPRPQAGGSVEGQAEGPGQRSRRRRRRRGRRGGAPAATMMGGTAPQQGSEPGGPEPGDVDSADVPPTEADGARSAASENVERALAPTSHESEVPAPQPPPSSTEPDAQ
jgi:hypothetical protein